jgi:hypothetical protein
MTRAQRRILSQDALIFRRSSGLVTRTTDTGEEAAAADGRGAAATAGAGKAEHSSCERLRACNRRAGRKLLNAAAEATQEALHDATRCAR